MPNRQSHPRNQSRLFKINSRARLAKDLHISPKKLRKIEKSQKNYKLWNDKKSGRDIQEPKMELARIHQRVAYLLSRIETPDFLHSAVKGRSYISNATQHNPNESTIKIDIKEFYRSVRIQEVYHFFHNRMQCSTDIAGLLENLLTFNGHLPTGSSSSPILSYFTYEEMFGKIHELAEKNDCKMTCYIDDMVFTGRNATNELFFSIIPIVNRYHLIVHKKRTFKAGQPKVITGVAITKRGPRVPYKNQRKIARGYKQLRQAVTAKKKIAILRPLIGRQFAAAQIDPTRRNEALLLNQELLCLES